MRTFDFFCCCELSEVRVRVTACSIVEIMLNSASHFSQPEFPARRWRRTFRSLSPLLVITFIFLAPTPIHSRNRSPEKTYGAGLMVSVPATEAELTQAVQDVVADGVIQGSKEYNKDEYISGAEAADSTIVFPRWNGAGQVFYKIRKNVLDPRNFKDSGDSGTLAVRYVVQHGDDKNTLLRIDAIFVDDFYRRDHLSNGSVETAEYKEIQDHIAASRLRKRSQDESAQHQSELANAVGRKREPEPEPQPSVAAAPDENLEQHVDRLRHELERVVKPGGARLRSAPFHSASSLKSLPAGSQVVILVSTPYWLGVETEGGEHGWIHHSDLGPLP